MQFFSLVLSALLLLVQPALAQQYTHNYSMRLFSQFIAYRIPFASNEFLTPVYQNQSRNGEFISETVPRGESPQRWTQMLTITAIRDAARGNRSIPMQAWMDEMARGYRSQCGGALRSADLGAVQIQGTRSARAVYIGCSRVPGRSFSEEVVMLLMVGRNDLYTYQWAEHGQARDSLPANSAERWRPRLSQMTEYLFFGQP